VGAHDVGFSIPELKDLQNSGIFQYVSFCFFGSENVTGSAQPTHIAGATVSPSYFAVLGVEAALGRTFDPHDASPGSNGEVIISDGLWKRAFGADPHILGKSLRLDTISFKLSASCPPAFATRAKPPRSAVPNCGRRMDFTATAPRCPSCIVEEAISGGLSAPG
jgi:putative ABC transport system permease protein